MMNEITGREIKVPYVELIALDPIANAAEQLIYAGVPVSIILQRVIEAYAEQNAATQQLLVKYLNKYGPIE